jgi:hypothetical protein
MQSYKLSVTQRLERSHTELQQKVRLEFNQHFCNLVEFFSTGMDQANAASSESSARAGRTSFRQEEIKKQLAEVEAKAAVLKLSLNYAQSTHQIEEFETIMAQLQEMETARDELNRKLRGLQLNQLRQRKRREKKKIGAESNVLMQHLEAPNDFSSEDLDHSPSNQGSKSPREDWKSKLENPQPPVFNFASSGLIATSSSSSSSSTTVQQTSQCSLPAPFIGLPIAVGNPAHNTLPFVPSSLQTPQAPQFPQVWKNTLIQQIIFMTEADFLDFIQTQIKNELRDLSVQIIQHRQQFLKDASLFGRENAVKFLFLQVECGLNLSPTQKLSLTNHFPVW